MNLGVGDGSGSGGSGGGAGGTTAPPSVVPPLTRYSSLSDCATCTSQDDAMRCSPFHVEHILQDGRRGRGDIAPP